MILQFYDIYNACTSLGVSQGLLWRLCFFSRAQKDPTPTSWIERQRSEAGPFPRRCVKRIGFAIRSNNFPYRPWMPWTSRSCQSHTLPSRSQNFDSWSSRGDALESGRCLIRVHLCQVCTIWFPIWTTSYWIVRGWYRTYCYNIFSRGVAGYGTCRLHDGKYRS